MIDSKRTWNAIQNCIYLGTVVVQSINKVSVVKLNNFMVDESQDQHLCHHTTNPLPAVIQGFAKDSSTQAKCRQCEAVLLVRNVGEQREEGEHCDQHVRHSSAPD